MKCKHVVLLIVLLGVVLEIGCQPPILFSEKKPEPSGSQTPFRVTTATKVSLTSQPGRLLTPVYRETSHPVRPSSTVAVKNDSNAAYPTITETPPPDSVPQMGNWVLSHLFYAKRVPDTNRTAIFSVLANGEEKTLYRDYASNPMWSFDGSLLAYISEEEVLGKWCIDKVATQEQLACLDDSGNVFSWHPTKQIIAYTSNGSLVSLDTVTMQTAILLEEGNMPKGLMTFLQWVDDERLLMVFENLEGCHLYLLDPGQKDAELLQAGIDSCDSFLPAFVARFSVNSQNILAFSTEASQSDQSAIILFDLSRKQEIQKIQISDERVLSPFWNPTNPQELAFTHAPAFTSSQVQVINVTTNEKLADLHYFVPSSGFFYGFGTPWSDDGQYLAISTWNSGETSMAVYSLEKHRIWFVDTDVLEIAWRPR